MKKNLKFAILFIRFLGGLVGGLAVSFFQTTTNTTTQTTKTSEKVTVSKVNYDNQTSVTEAVKKVQDAVVSVISYKQGSGNVFIFGNQDSSDELAVSSEGSGVIYKRWG